MKHNPIRDIEDACRFLGMASTCIEQALPYFSGKTKKSLRKISLDSVGHGGYLARVSILKEDLTSTK